MGRVQTESPVMARSEVEPVGTTISADTSVQVGRQLFSRVSEYTPAYLSTLVQHAVAAHDTAKGKVAALNTLENHLAKYAEPLVEKYGANVEAFSLRSIDKVESTVRYGRDLVNAKVLEPVEHGKNAIGSRVVAPVGAAYVTGRQLVEEQVVRRVGNAVQVSREHVDSAVGSVRARVNGQVEHRSQQVRQLLSSVDTLSQSLKDRTYTLACAAEDYGRGPIPASSEESSSSDSAEDKADTQEEVTETVTRAPFTAKRVLNVGVSVSSRIQQDTFKIAREWQQSLKELRPQTVSGAQVVDASLELSRGVTAALSTVSDLSLHEWIVLRGYVLTLSRHAQDLGATHLETVASRLRDLVSRLPLSKAAPALDQDGNPIEGDAATDATAHLDANGTLTRVRDLVDLVRAEAQRAVARTREDASLAIARVTETTLDRIPDSVRDYLTAVSRGEGQTALEPVRAAVAQLYESSYYAFVEEVVKSSIDRISDIVAKTRAQIRTYTSHKESPTTTSDSTEEDAKSETVDSETALDNLAADAAASIREHAKEALKTLANHVDTVVQNSFASPATTNGGTPRKLAEPLPTPSPFASSVDADTTLDESSLDVSALGSDVLSDGDASEYASVEENAE